MSSRDKKKRTTIPAGVIGRLPTYYRYLLRLQSRSAAKVSSAQLGEALGMTAAQVRSDFSYFGSFGQQGYGYRVDDLLEQIHVILGLDRGYQTILLGAGNLGRAVASYDPFRKLGFEIQAIFDSSSLLEGSYLAGCIIQPISYLETYLNSRSVDIGFLTTPAEASQELCDVLVKYGVRGIWNFSPARLKVPEGTVVENVHFTDSLLKLSFRINNNDPVSGAETVLE